MGADGGAQRNVFFVRKGVTGSDVDKKCTGGPSGRCILCLLSRIKHFRNGTRSNCVTGPGCRRSGLKGKSFGSKLCYIGCPFCPFSKKCFVRSSCARVHLTRVVCSRTRYLLHLKRTNRTNGLLGDIHGHGCRGFATSVTCRPRNGIMLSLGRVLSR